MWTVVISVLSLIPYCGVKTTWLLLSLLLVISCMWYIKHSTGLKLCGSDINNPNLNVYLHLNINEAEQAVFVV